MIIKKLKKYQAYYVEFLSKFNIVIFYILRKEN